jgi:hypothetical protein
MSKSLPISTPPVYCHFDGKRLVQVGPLVAKNGYDVFTGMRLADSEGSTFLQCEDRGPQHDTWVLVGDRWVQP